jgi:RNA-directed DNA polymerase
MMLVEGSISDGRVLTLIERFLHQEIMSDMARWQPTTGTPQGAVLSPLLANLYLHPFDLLMERGGYRMVRYADDFVILCASEAAAEAALRQVTAWTAANGLTLHPDKTRIGDSRQPGQGFDLLGYRFEAGCRFVRSKSLKAFKNRVRHRTIRSRGDSLGRIIAVSTRCCGGWFGSFKHARPRLYRRLEVHQATVARRPAQAGEASVEGTKRGRPPALDQCLLRGPRAVHPARSLRRRETPR